jgi:hypothetical protein
MHSHENKKSLVCTFSFTKCGKKNKKLACRMHSYVHLRWEKKNKKNKQQRCCSLGFIEARSQNRIQQRCCTLSFIEAGREKKMNSNHAAISASMKLGAKKN